MVVRWLILSVPAAYLLGSINFAILVSALKGVDIRSAGNRKPGTANTGRVLGKGWAALVFTGDLAKGLVPLFLARWLFFHGDDPADFFGLLLTGMAVIAGHCWPVWHGFRGGGGLATSIGIYMFFIPVVFFSSLLISFIIVRSFLWSKEYSAGQIVPMFFVPMAPLILLVTRFLPEIPLGNHVLFYQPPWYCIIGIFMLSLYLIAINIRVVTGRFSRREKT